MTKSRTRNSIKNASITTISQLISIFMLFINRTLFILFLGNEYLSVNGLFTNILALLSFTELGIGSAIVYSLYKPLVDNDKNKIVAIMNLYKKAYTWIAIVITILGLSIIPLIDLIINEPPDISESLLIIYLLFLTNSVASYIFSYKKAIITADQKEYIVTVYRQVILIIQAITQALVLIFFDSFIGYLIIQLLFTLLNNILVFRKANKLYPYLMGKNAVTLPAKEKKSIFENIKAMFYYKFGSVILTGTDNIIISSLLNISLVGLVSNYILIITSLNNIVAKAFESIAASVGNLNASSRNKEQNRQTFDQLFLIVFWIFGFSSICLVILLNPFIEVWIGNQYTLSKIVIISMVLAFYVLGMNSVASMYRTTLGYFKQAQFTPLLASIINIVLSILFGKWFGLHGIFFATVIARVCTFGIIDPMLVYKKFFKLSAMIYHLKYAYYTLIMVITFTVNDYIVGVIQINGVIGLTIKLLVSIIIINCIFLLLFHKSREFIEIKQRVRSIYNKRFKDRT